MLIDGHLLIARGRGAILIIIIKSLGHGDVLVLIELAVLVIRRPLAMRGLVVIEQAEGLFGGAGFHEIEGLVAGRSR